jgi:hypothetical protein
MGSAHTRAHGPAGGAAKGAPAGALIVVGAAYGDVREIDELGLVKIPPELLFRLSNEDCAWLTVVAVETKAAVGRN